MMDFAPWLAPGSTLSIESGSVLDASRDYEYGLNIFPGATAVLTSNSVINAHIITDPSAGGRWDDGVLGFSQYFGDLINNGAWLTGSRSATGLLSSRFEVHGDLIQNTGALEIFASGAHGNDLTNTFVVSGDAILGGKLVVRPGLNGVDRTREGDELILLSASSITGRFTEVVYPAFPDRLRPVLEYREDSVVLRVVPAPGAAGPVVIAGLFATRRRRP